MQTTLLKTKLHRATVTHSELAYEGSCAIDSDILDFAQIKEYEQIHIYNINTGGRFITYAIRAKAGSGIFSINGAAARLACPGDLIIVCTFANFDAAELENYKPMLVYFNEHNKITHSMHSICTQVA